eukprot:scaffold49372_cov73-Phaeocystis_antarctica.AAC.2
MPARDGVRARRDGDGSAARESVRAGARRGGGGGRTSPRRAGGCVRANGSRFQKTRCVSNVRLQCTILGKASTTRTPRLVTARAQSAPQRHTDTPMHTPQKRVKNASKTRAVRAVMRAAWGDRDLAAAAARDRATLGMAAAAARDRATLGMAAA